MVTHGHGEHPAATSRRSSLGKKYNDTTFPHRLDIVTVEFDHDDENAQAASK